MIVDAESILKICGVGTYLQVGCENSTLVCELLKRSIDAYGMDSSEEFIENMNQQAPGRFILGSLRNYPFYKANFDTIIIGYDLLEFNSNDLVLVLNSLSQMTKRNLVIYFPPNSQRAISPHNQANSRLYWEQCAITAGFRKHPRSMLVTPYQELENERTDRFLFLEKIPDQANQRFSLDWLLSTRDLHMDMLREAGRRSDGHVSRYVYAATKIRPGDVVLDAACGMGYGTAVLASCSPGSRFIGVDIDEESISYAQHNYADGRAPIEFKTCDVTKMSFLTDHSVDAVVSFETIEHVPDYDAFLKEVKRVLKPDGRFIGSVPHMWCDETGNDPNPYHFHVFDWDKLNKAVSKYFIVDERWAQVAGGGYKMNKGQRVMHRIPLNLTGIVDTEWWVIAACGNPLGAETVPYTNPFARNNKEAIPAHVDFAKYYDNPWLYRVIIQLGERLSDTQVLTDICTKVALESRIGSADQGAALCVIGYQILESGHVKFDDVIALANLINEFDQAYDKSNIHAVRWAISLYYIGARLLLALGQREEALRAFLTCAEMNPLVFSPLLATKTISSRMYAGLLSASVGNLEEARNQFILAVNSAQHVMQGEWKNIVGSTEHPLAFGLQEAAEILDIASQCSQALHAIDKQEFSPGYFWGRVNLKRFGLVEWNKSLERENIDLRHQLATRHIEMAAKAS